MVNKRFNLLNDFELEGNWWLPDRPTEKIPGKLSFKNDEHIELSLLGDFRRNNTRIEIILGTTFEGHHCTLLDCYFVGPAIQAVGYGSRAFFVASYIFVGRHFNAVSEIKFPSILVNYSFLEEWLNSKPFEVGYGYDGQAGKWNKLQVHYSAPKGFEIHAPSVKATISTHFGVHSDKERFRRTELNFTAYIKIAPEKPMDHTWFLNSISNLGSFLTLLIGKPVYIKRIKYLDTNEDFEDDSSVDILFEQRRRVESDFINPRAILAPFTNIEDNLADVLNAWFIKSQELSTIFNLLLGTLYNPYQFRVSTFLNLAQALESYQRHLNTDKYIPDERYDAVLQELIKAIPSELPTELKESLKSKLNYGNEFSLRTRLKRIISGLSPEHQKVLYDDSKKFVNEIIFTRNYYTHYDKSLEKKAAKGNSLIELNTKLRALLIILLYKEIMISDEVIKTAVERYLNPPFFYFPDID